MKLIGNYSEDVKNLIDGEEQYSIPSDIIPVYTQEDYNVALEESPIDPGQNFSNGFPVIQDPNWNPGVSFGAPTLIPDQSKIGSPTQILNSGYQERPVIKLNVLNSVGLFRGDFDLEFNVDYYIKNNKIFLKPNELLDRQEYRAGEYTLNFDFLRRLNVTNTENNDRELYLAEISPSRKEIRLNTEPKSSDQIEVQQNQVSKFLRNSNTIDPNSETYERYKFEGFIELSGGQLIPINAFAFDNISNQGRNLSLILKLNEEFPTDINLYDKSIRIVRKWFESQSQVITFVDKENLATGGNKPLAVDTSYVTENSFIEDRIESYENLSTGSLDIISDLTINKKDQNLNIDFSKFSNHVFFGSAVSKLENFKSKVVKLEGLYSQVSRSLSINSTITEIQVREKLFNDIRKEKESFTVYERFMYNDNQTTTPNSAPGLGVNLAGNNFKNSYKNNNVERNIYTILTGSSAEGFDRLHQKTGSSTESDFIHLFTDLYNVEQPPFFNTNNNVYLSFVLKNTGSLEQLHISGGMANLETNNIGYNGYTYRRGYQIPANAFTGSMILNPVPTGSHYKRYIFKSQQNYFRPEESEKDVFNISDYTSTSTAWEILSGSNVTSASTSGSIGDGFAYGIRDSSGQQTQYIFPTVVDRNNLSNTFTFITGSLLPQGDLFPVFINSSISNAKFTDVHVSYNNPTDVHPFSTVYRPPSGSYAGSDEWNNWYSGIYASASLYDNDNIHSLLNNLPKGFREGSDHDVLRAFVNMLGEQFDLLRNYIDNYLNFYKLGYTNPNSMPDNLLPILGDTVGWELLNTQNKNTSIEDYATNTAGDEVGVQAVINSTWKKILNNLIYVYKTKGTTEAINSLLNLYGFDSNGFKMREYGGSTAEHNPTIITNDSQEFLEGMTNIKGNVSYVKSVEPFPMMNFRGTNSLGVDWWRNDSTPNGIEFVFNADKSLTDQTILRSSGSNNDLWDLRLIPSASSTQFSQLQFRLNTTPSGSGTITNSAISMSSPFVDFQNGNIYNVFLQRLYVTGSTPNHLADFTQSYHMFVGRKDDDKIRNVSATSMSCHISGANFNFVEQAAAKESKNLFVGETLSGSVAEVRAWDSYVSMSKFKQHTLNYRSTVTNTITGSVASLIYRYPFDENIVNWSTNPNSASLKVHDANSQNVKDYSILIASQSNFNYKTTMTEQTFYRLGIKGTDKLPNDNQTNLTPKVTVVGSLDPDQASVQDPTDASGQPERQFTNQFGRDVSYVNAIDTLVMNAMPDFRIDDFIGDPDEQLTDTYEDLMKLRKALLIDPDVRIDVEQNIRAVENILTDEVKETLEIMTPAKTNFEMFYDIKNDTLFRSKIPKRAQLQTKLNPNKATGIIDADQFDEPKIQSFANNNLKEGIIDADQWDEPKINSFVNNKVVTGKIDADQWDEPTINSFANHKVVEGKIDADQWDEPTLTSNFENIQGGSDIDVVSLSNSKLANNYNASLDKMNEFFLGPKNHIGKNQGTESFHRFFKSKNPGVHGDFNTYKFENRFTFKTIGDTERFHNSSSHHDVFTSFRNRHFVDQNHVSNFKYESFFGTGAEVNGAPKPGRMVGRTRFFFTDSDGNITYPSNHYINARTSKDGLLKLIYEGTQNDGGAPTQDPIKNDPQPTVAAYVVSVAGSDTINRIKVDRPISKNIRLITINARGNDSTLTFNLFKRSKLIMSKNLHTRGTTFPARDKIKFNLVGDVKDYNFTITPSTSLRRVDGVRVQRIKEGGQFVQKASISLSRNPDGSVRGRFTKIMGDFSLQVQMR